MSKVQREQQQQAETSAADIRSELQQCELRERKLREKYDDIVERKDEYKAALAEHEKKAGAPPGRALEALRAAVHDSQILILELMNIFKIIIGRTSLETRTIG